MPESRTEPKRWMLPALALFTLLGMGGIGALLIVFVQDRSLVAAIQGLLGTAPQLGIGLATGLAMAWGGWLIIRQPMLGPVLDRYASLVGPLMPVAWQQVLVSVCAGAGEELLFRGAVQHWLGIPLTAVLFVALHGYLDPRNPRLSLYGLYLTGWMLLFGWFAEHHGLLAPMLAHAVFDLVLIRMLVKHWRAGGAS